jgi:hypothetical protein
MHSSGLALIKWQPNPVKARPEELSRGPEDVRHTVQKEQSTPWRQGHHNCWIQQLICGRPYKLMIVGRS